MRSTSVTRLASLSVFIVLTVVLTRFASFRVTIAGVEGVRIGVGALGIYLAAFIFGPIDGAVVGALSDILGYWISPMGPYMPHFTLTAALKGGIAGLVFVYVFKRRWKLLPITVSIAIPAAINSLWLVPYFLHTLFGMPYSLMLVPRLIAYPIVLVLEVAIIEAVLGLMRSSRVSYVKK